MITTLRRTTALLNMFGNCPRTTPNRESLANACGWPLGLLTAAPARALCFLSISHTPIGLTCSPHPRRRAVEQPRRAMECQRFILQGVQRTTAHHHLAMTTLLVAGRFIERRLKAAALCPGQRLRVRNARKLSTPTVIVKWGCGRTVRNMGKRVFRCTLQASRLPQICAKHSHAADVYEARLEPSLPSFINRRSIKKTALTIPWSEKPASSAHLS